MSLSERFQYGCQENKRYNPWRVPTPAIQYEEKETGRMELRGFDDQKEYALSVRCVATFWANRAQLPQARKSAERVLMDTLYRDLMARLSHLENLISSGDQEEAYDAVIELRKEFMTP